MVAYLKIMLIIILVLKELVNSILLHVFWFVYSLYIILVLELRQEGARQEAKHIQQGYALHKNQSVALETSRW